jgi:hypothetical protein
MPKKNQFQTGAKIIAFLFTIFCSVDLLWWFLSAEKSGFSFFDTIIIVVGLFVVIFLWYGLIEMRQGFFIPFLVFMVTVS